MEEQLEVCMPPDPHPMNATANESTNQTCQTEMRSINIQPLNRGYVVNVGCQSVAVSSKRELKRLLNDYIDDPYQVEQDYYAGKILPKE
jgi:hypothetical protein